MSKSHAGGAGGATADAEVRVCAWSELAPSSARRVDVHGAAVAVVRIGDDVYAIGDTCSHAEVSLSEGAVLDDECEIECWRHGATFSLRTGRPCSLPATLPVPCYAVRVDGDDVLVAAVPREGSDG